MNYLENLLIYFSNLSTFYIFSVAISLAIVVLTIYLGVVTRFTIGGAESESCSKSQQLQSHQSERNDSESDSGEDEDDEDDDDDEDDEARIESVRQLKSAKLKSLEENLTDEQREAEKEIERVQLAAIYELLKKQNEEFSLGSNLDEDDLKEQLSLYR